MSRLKRLLHVSNPSTCNTQQVHVQPCKAVAQHMHTAQQVLLHVVPASPSNTQQTSGIVFEFTVSTDPDHDDEAFQERVAIMMEGNGWDEATAFREARLDMHRQRCWRVFKRNAQRILEVPQHQRAELLMVYQQEAARHYGVNDATIMAAELTLWVNARGTGGVQ